jgi:hypothetical protein
VRRAARGAQSVALQHRESLVQIKWAPAFRRLQLQLDPHQTGVDAVTVK